MALIFDRNKGRADGGYTRVFGDAQLGALISQVHATSISAGTELEKMICNLHTQVMSEQNLADFLNQKLTNGTWLISKKLTQKHIKKNIGSTSEPDFIFIIIADKNAYIVELKDGDTFDTKKSKGEIDSCRRFAQLFGNYLLKNNLFYKTDIRICCFNQSSHDEIVKGFKGQISKKEAWTGKELCKTLGISYENILKQREVHQEQNIKYFVDELKKVDPINRLIKIESSIS